MSPESGKGIRSLFVLDTEAPWIRLLLHAMPPDVRIFGFRVRNAFSFPGGLRGQLQKVGSSENGSESWNDTWVSIPGWNKAFGLSSWLVTRQIQKAIGSFGQPSAIMFNLPWYAGVAGAFSGVIKAYYAYDPYRFYDWDNTKVIPLEKKLLGNCDVGFGVAKLLVEDMRAMSTTPVHYLPNATLWSPGVTNLEWAAAARKDFELVPRPRVGCVGQINSNAYDWDLIEYLSASLPSAHFVFVGPRFKEKSTAAASRIEAVFALPNVHWIGPKPHSELPAYLRCFDVCINPLAATEHNHRRSPLRLFDYLATDRPIVSTAIAEAFSHVPFVSIAEDKEEFRRLLGEALTLEAAPDLERRRSYIVANTWHARAAELCALLNQASSVPSADTHALLERRHN